MDGVVVEKTISIRKFNAGDKESVRKISCETAFLEEDRRYFFDDDEILADTLTFYFTDYEPDSCFVAIDNYKVIGYLVGALDVRKMNGIFMMRIMPKVFFKTIRKGIFFRRNNLVFFTNVIMSCFKGEFYLPDFSKQYPATLHINIDREYRGLKVGSKLIENYMNFLKLKKVSGVHFGTMSEKAKMFFTKMGFKILFEDKRSYLKYYLKRISPYYICGKLL